MTHALPNAIGVFNTTSKCVCVGIYSIRYSSLMHRVVVFIRCVECAGSILFDILVFLVNRQVLSGWSFCIIAVNKREVTKLPHHVASELCTTGTKYRQGKKLTAVKAADNRILQHLIKSLMMICLSLFDSFLGSLSTLMPKSFCYFCNIIDHTRSSVILVPCFIAYHFVVSVQ